MKIVWTACGALTAMAALFAAIVVSPHDLRGVEDGAAKAELDELERLTIAYAGATDEHAMARMRHRVYAQREIIAKRGRAVLALVRQQLRHSHKNVRRGAAIVSYMIIEKEDMASEELLGGFLEHMVREDDLKCRSNLRNVVLIVVRGLRSQK